MLYWHRLFCISLHIIFLAQTLYPRVFVAPQREELFESLHGLRAASTPFISGDTFRSISDFIIDEKRLPFNTSLVKDGDIIFLKTDFLGFFFEQVHPHIDKKYILITHNSDASAPGKWYHFLNSENLIAWFGQNCDRQHPKFIPIPIGLANRYWKTGNPAVFNELMDNQKNTERPYLTYLNIDPGTHPERGVAIQTLANKEWCISPGRKPHKDYLTDLQLSKFVICPRGNGLDCHRQWEALLMGAVPIVKKSTIDQAFQDLPVLIVNDWSEITETFLTEEYKRLQSCTYSLERLFAAYWINKIKEVQQSIRLQFSNVIDVVIPCHSKDSRTLQLAIDGIRTHGKNVRRIIVVSDKRITTSAEWFDEKLYPFSKHDIALALFNENEENAKMYEAYEKNRLGWAYQQLLKLYAPLVIPNISPNVLILDADTIFLKDATFIDSDNKPLYNVGTENVKVYFEHAKRLLPGFERFFQEYSGICHHMLFQRHVIQDLFNTITHIHNGIAPWKAFCYCVDIDAFLQSESCYSEYEIYFNFLFLYGYPAKIRPLSWKNHALSQSDLALFKHYGYDYVSCHAYIDE